MFEVLCDDFNSNCVSQQDHRKQVVREVEAQEDKQGEVKEEEAEPFEDWQREVKEEAEPLEDWQREVEEEEAEPLEDWQREVEEDDLEEEEAESAGDLIHDGRESSREEMKMSLRKRKKMVCMALPFLTGISPAGFLSANRKQPGGTDLLVQVTSALVT